MEIYEKKSGVQDQQSIMTMSDIRNRTRTSCTSQLAFALFCCCLVLKGGGVDCGMCNEQTKTFLLFSQY